MAGSKSKAAYVFAAAVIAIPLVLGGCKTTGSTDGGELSDASWTSNSHLTPEEKALRDDAEVFNETVFGGAATGAIIAGGICALAAILGNNGGNQFARCAVMAGIGGAVGALDGYLVAKRQEAANRKVREIDLVTEEIEGKNVKLRRLVASSRKVVEQNRKSLEEVRTKVATQNARLDELEREKERLEANIDVIDDTLENLNEEKDGYQEVAEKLKSEGRDTTKLEAQISEMKQQIVALEQERNELEAINKAVRIG